MHEVALLDVLAPTEVHPSHPARFQAMSEGPFDQFASLAVQGSASSALDPTTVRVDGLLRILLALPLASASVRFGYVAAHPNSLDGRERVVAVVPVPPGNSAHRSQAHNHGILTHRTAAWLARPDVLRRLSADAFPRLLL